MYYKQEIVKTVETYIRDDENHYDVSNTDEQLQRIK